MKRYDLSSECLCGVGFEPSCEESQEGEWGSAETAQELYDLIAEIASLYKSDIVPSDDYCWDEVVEMCRKAKKKADED